VGPHYQPPTDSTSARILAAMPDPEHKIHIGPDMNWINKEIMAQAATDGLKADILLQLDADEFWPPDTFRAAVNEVWTSDVDRLGVAQVMFFGDCDHFAMPLDGTQFWWFRPIRLMKWRPGLIARHMPPSAVDAHGVLQGTHDKTGIRIPPVWHFAWVGRERGLRKRAYYANGRGLPMFGEKDWKAGVWSGGWQTNFGPMIVRRCADVKAVPARFGLPEDLRAAVMEAIGEAVVTG
jgi:hypothetical protein